VELIRIDSDNGPIHFMEPANVEGVLTIKGVNVVVEFVPEDWLDGGQGWRLSRVDDHNITKMSTLPA
jgi:hypothetical protein